MSLRFVGALESAVLVLNFILPTSVEAKKPDFWLRCDGHSKPKPSGEEIGRSLLALGTLGLTGLPDKTNLRARAKGKPGVEACTEALAYPKLEKFPVRHAKILKARSVHYLEAKDPSSALADINAIPTFIDAASDDDYFHETWLIQLNLIRAVAYLMDDQLEKSRELLLKVSESKPYSGSIQTYVAGLLLANPKAAAEERVVLQRLMSVEPGNFKLAAQAVNWSDDADQRLGFWQSVMDVDATEKAMEAAKRAASKKKKKTDESVSVTFGMSPSKEELDATVLAGAALSAARAGKGDLATQYLDRAIAAQTAAHEKLEKLLPKLGEKSDPTKDNDSFMPLIYAMQAQARAQAYIRMKQWVDTPIELAQAFQSINEGQKTALQKDGQISVTPASADLLTRIASKREESNSLQIINDGLKDAALSAKLNIQKNLQLQTLFDNIPAAQKKASVNGYSGQVGLGLKWTGFKGGVNDDGNGAHVEFAGNATSRVPVEDMVILRAADFAHQARKRAFIVVKRIDYNRVNRSTFNGRAVGEGTLVGYKTAIDVVFVDPDNIPTNLGHAKDRVLIADEVWDELAPVYTTADTK